MNASVSSTECYTGGDDDSSCSAVDASAGILVRAYAGGDDDAGLGGGYYVGLRIWSGSVSIQPDSGCSGSSTVVSVADTITLKPDTSYNLGVAVDGDTLAVFVDGLYVTDYTMDSRCSGDRRTILFLSFDGAVGAARVLLCRHESSSSSSLRDDDGDDDGASRHSKDCRPCLRLTSNLTLDCVCAWTRAGVGLASCSSGSVALASEYAAASFESMDVFDATLSVTSASLLFSDASATAESTTTAESIWIATSRDEVNTVSAKAEAMASEAQAEAAPEAQAEAAPEAQAEAAPEVQAKPASEAQAEAASEAQAEAASETLAPLAVHDALSPRAKGGALFSTSSRRRRAAATKARHQT